MVDTPTVVVAMSGGVDSSVAAALLVEQGYRVIGMMLRLWNEPGKECENRCCTPEAMALARRVAAKLGIPFYAIDAQERFRETVVEAFLDGYLAGETPNPCVVCNRQIRWGLLRERALTFGADYFATGHYARVERGPDGTAHLLRGLDSAKDQSYVLSVIPQEQLRQTLFPVGQYPKPEVRALAQQFDLPVAARADSQDLCFLAGGDYRDFLTRTVPQVVRPGPIVDTAGNALGSHQGLAFYTIGQRKGLGIASPEPLYVVRKDAAANTLVVGGVDALGGNRLRAEAINWINGVPAGEIRVQAKIRYKARDAWATLRPDGADAAALEFDDPVRDSTPGQRVVFYQGDLCLGGGTIRPVEEQP